MANELQEVRALAQSAVAPRASILLDPGSVLNLPSGQTYLPAPNNPPPPPSFPPPGQTPQTLPPTIFEQPPGYGDLGPFINTAPTVTHGGPLPAPSPAPAPAPAPRALPTPECYFLFETLPKAHQDALRAWWCGLRTPIGLSDAAEQVFLALLLSTQPPPAASCCMPPVGNGRR